jgi:hypothetical protein
MYSYVDRVRAVKLFIKLGKRVRATIRQLGYPNQECPDGLAPGIRATFRFAGGLSAATLTAYNVSTGSAKT